MAFESFFPRPCPHAFRGVAQIYKKKAHTQTFRAVGRLILAAKLLPFSLLFSLKMF